MTKNIAIEALRMDRADFNNNLMGHVIKVNKLRGTLDVRVSGTMANILSDVAVVGGQSIFDINVGDKVVVSNFSGTWVVLGTVQSPTRQSLHKFHTMEALDNATTYGEAYFYKNVSFDAGEHYLYLSGDDLYWWDGTSGTKLN